MRDLVLIETLDDAGWGRVGALVGGAGRVSVLTGAGVSAESGLATFRGGGLWEDFRIEDVATPEAFARDPAMVWRFYNYRRKQLALAKPNDAHRALVDLESKFGDRFTLITQNVDGLHQAAGSAAVIELHGSIRRVRCTECRSHFASMEELGEMPLCGCGGLLRPDVVWFGEALPAQALLTAQRAVDRGGVLLVIGTSAVVYPAAGLIDAARRAGACVIEVNSAETAATERVDVVLRGAAAAMMPRLVGEILR